MQTIFNRDGTPTIHNVLLNTIDIERGTVAITFDDNRHEPVEFESLYPYFISGQVARTRYGDDLLIVGKEKGNKLNIVLYNITTREAQPINALNYNWDYTYYDDDGNRNNAYDIMSFWKIMPLGNLVDVLNGDYVTLSNKITPEFDDIRLKDDLI